MVLRGIVHRPAGEPVGPPVLLLSGWGGTRYGPNGILVEAARALAADGFACLRVDFRGRGDSDGAVGEHDLSCHIEDAATIAEWCRAEVDPRPPYLLGICSGGEVAVGALFAGVDAAGVCLWSAPVFAAEGTRERRATKRAAYLGEYARKLLRRETWRKLFGGEIRFDLIRRVLGRAGVHEKTGNEPEELIEGARFGARCEGALLVYGGADPVAEEACPFYLDLFGRAGCPLSSHTIDGANHGFYALGWKHEAIAVTREWLVGRHS
jgi:pimeloyl-ACP methyl ester carboxylesterase